jgi:two-component system nitrogen regulation response regulator GlnG
MPAELQTRLLRVLSDGQYYRIGGYVPVNVDIRIVAATHQNLENLVKQRLFREDLFHRLNVIRIKIPALRDRTEDIEGLLDYFLFKVASEIDGEVKKVSPDVFAYIKTLAWPGNVRQLENLARWLVVMASAQEVTMDDLPPELLAQSGDVQEAIHAVGSNWQKSLANWASSSLQKGEKELIKKALPEFERILILAALAKTKNKKLEAAELLGWGRNTLTRKISELKIESQ